MYYVENFGKEVVRTLDSRSSQLKNDESFTIRPENAE